MPKAATQVELNRFFQVRDQSEVPVAHITAEAFFHARLKFHETAFIDLNSVVVSSLYKAIEPQT